MNYFSKVSKKLSLTFFRVEPISLFGGTSLLIPFCRGFISLQQNSGKGELKILNQEIAYEGWSTIKKKKMLFQDGKSYTFDIVEGGKAILVFPWNTSSKTLTLLREYCPGPNRNMYSIIAGLFESEKHESIRQCAIFEAEEEANLQNGKLIPLLNDENRYIVASKYSTLCFYPFLLLNGQISSNPSRKKDDEEILTPIYDVTTEKLMKIAQQGKMTGTAIMLSFLALEKLKEMGEI